MNYITEYLSAYRNMFNYSGNCSRGTYSRYIFTSFFLTLIFVIMLPLLGWWLIQTSAFTLETADLLNKFKEVNHYADFIITIALALIFLVLILMPLFLSYFAITARRMNDLKISKKWLFLLIPLSLLISPVMIIFTAILMIKKSA